MTNTLYVVDTSSLVTLVRSYPRDVFPSVWTAFDPLIKSAMLVAPTAVKRELKQGHDELVPWAKENTHIFYQRSSAQSKTVSNIMHEHNLTEIHDSSRTDLWVVALAKEFQSSLYSQVMIVTEEKIKGAKVRIPFIAQKHGLESINLLAMFRRERWQF